MGQSTILLCVKVKIYTYQVNGCTICNKGTCIYITKRHFERAININYLLLSGATMVEGDVVWIMILYFQWYSVFSSQSSSKKPQQIHAGLAWSEWFGSFIHIHSIVCSSIGQSQTSKGRGNAFVGICELAGPPYGACSCASLGKKHPQMTHLWECPKCGWILSFALPKAKYTPEN